MEAVKTFLENQSLFALFVFCCWFVLTPLFAHAEATAAPNPTAPKKRKSLREVPSSAIFFTSERI